jgi:hypothetical protein
MRRILGLIAALLFAVAPRMASAQNLSLKGGLSYGNVSNSGLLPGELDHRSGFAAGLALTPAAAAPLGLGIEALYAQRGVESSTDGDSRHLNYIDVPLYLRASIPITGAAPFLYAGPQLSFELSCHADPGDCPDSDRPKTSYAATIGGGVRLGGRSALTLEGRYIYGLTDLKLGTITSSTSYKTRSFLLLAGLTF